MDMNLTLPRFIQLLLCLFLLTGCAATPGNISIGSGLVKRHEINSVSFYKQMGKSCGLQAAKTIADFWDVELAEKETIDSSKIEEQGLQVKEVVDILQKSGLEVQLIHSSPKELADLIDANIPVVAVVNSNGALDFPHPFLKKAFWGHTFVVHGYDDEKQMVKTNFPEEKDVWLTYDLFFEYWGDTRYMAVIAWDR